MLELPTGKGTTRRIDLGKVLGNGISIVFHLDSIVEHL